MATTAISISGEPRATGKVGKHGRVPWSASDPREVIVHCRWDELKGTWRQRERDAKKALAIYAAAKLQFDQEAADELVEKWVNEAAIDSLVDRVLGCGKAVRIVTPHPEFDSADPTGNPFEITNAIPFAFQAFLASELGCEIEHEIVELARPGRTSLSKFQRFLWQPRFSGAVQADCAYIVADDVCTTAGTLAALRRHIMRGGGTVIAVTALACHNGKNMPFPIADVTRASLFERYGSELGSLWIEEVGHGIECLTEGEGSYLAEAVPPGKGDAGRPDALLQRLRDRLAETKGKGSE